MFIRVMCFIAIINVRVFMYPFYETEKREIILLFFYFIYYQLRETYFSVNKRNV